MKKSIILISFTLIMEHFCRQLLDNLDNDFINSLKEVINLNYDVYINFLICVIGVAGVFLALYYSNISTIYSSEYGNMPDRIRKLFIYEINQNRSINRINEYIIFITLVLVCNFIGLKTWYISIIIVTVKTVDIVISFINRGSLIYEYANVYKVLKNRKIDMLYCVQSATKPNIFHNYTMQQTYGKNALRILEDMNTVNQFILDKEDLRQKESVKEFLIENNNLLIIYLREKNKIMFNSPWFQAVVKHKKWHDAAFYEKNIAISTGTELSPKSVLDIDWFEKIVLEMNEKGLKYLIDNNCYKEIQEYLLSLSECNLFWIKYGDVSLLYKHFVFIVNSIMSNMQKEENQFQMKEQNTIEYIKFVMIEFILKVREYMLNINVKKFNIFRSKKYQFSDKNLIGFNDIIINNSIFYNTYKSLKIEKKIEKMIKTPEWYINQEISKQLAKRVMELIDLVREIYFLNKQIVEKLSKKEQYEYGSSVLANENELFNKIKTLYEDTKSIIEEIDNNYSDEKNNLEKYICQNYGTISSYHEDEIPPLWTEYCENLWLNSSSEERDYFGFFYNNLCETLFDSIIKFDYDKFEKYYNGLFRLAILSEIHIHKELQDDNQYSEYTKFNKQFSGLNSMFILSGYAIIVGEILNDKRWKEKIDSEIKAFIEKKDKIDFSEQIIRWKNIIQLSVEDVGRFEIDSTSMASRFKRAIDNSDKLQFEYIGPFGNKKIINTNNLKNIGYSEFDGIFVDMREIYAVASLNKFLPENELYTSKRLSIEEWEEMTDEEK